MAIGIRDVDPWPYPCAPQIASGRADLESPDAGQLLDPPPDRRPRDIIDVLSGRLAGTRSITV